MRSLTAYISTCTALSFAYALTSEEAQAAPSLLSLTLALLCTSVGQLALFNAFFALTVGGLRLLQFFVFGSLRVVEWQRLWDSLIHLMMGQLVVLGAIVEPDWAELLLWTGFAIFNGALALLSGLCRDRLDYMAHLPAVPSAWTYIRVLALQIGIISVAAAVLFLGGALLTEAGASALSLFFFQAAIILVDGFYTLMQAYLQWRERRAARSDTASSDALYYATLVPELSMQFSRLCHYLHVWYVHGLSFSVIDVLLLANTKAAFEALQQRLVTHLNFLRADANLQRRFRAASAEELAELNDCCAICRESMDSATVLPCGHFFHYRCLRSWLEQSHSCPICRASLTAAPASAPPQASANGPTAAAAGRSGGGGGALARAARDNAARAAPNQPLAAAGSSSASASAEGERERDTPHAADSVRRAEQRPEGADADGGEAGEGDEAYEEDGEEHSYLLFSSEHWHWPSWLPRFHLEVIRRTARAPETRQHAAANTTEEDLRQLRDVFPQQSEVALRRALLRAPSLELAIESLLGEM